MKMAERNATRPTRERYRGDSSITLTFGSDPKGDGVSAAGKDEAIQTFNLRERGIRESLVATGDLQVVIGCRAANDGIVAVKRGGGDLEIVIRSGRIVTHQRGAASPDTRDERVAEGGSSTDSIALDPDIATGHAGGAQYIRRSPTEK